MFESPKHNGPQHEARPDVRLENNVPFWHVFLEEELPLTVSTETERDARRKAHAFMEAHPEEMSGFEGLSLSEAKQRIANFETETA